SSGHHLFVSVFMLTLKVICDNTYSNKSWSIVVQGMFQLREINQVRRQYPSGHHLFVSAFMLTLKVICDDTYSNKSCPTQLYF
ncbi:hypothetical protein F4604DRAFT_1587937, partial [Suillus subluteus]